MTAEQVDEWKRELMHDLAEAVRAARAQASQQPPTAEHVARDTHWMGEMLHPDDTTRYGW
jgi:hypothetical protein